VNILVQIKDSTSDYMLDKASEFLDEMVVSLQKHGGWNLS